MSATSTFPGPAWTREQVTRGVKEATAYGLISEKHVAGFVEATCLLLGGFRQRALPKPALAILRSYGMDPELKLRRYREWCASVGREAAWHSAMFR
ncbi:MAG: hypothetical protein ABI806_18260 [Candidatus Solibacter sp.]